MLFSSKCEEATFAFDNVNDYNIIEEKLKLIDKYTSKICRFYILCGFDRENRYDLSFWINDIESIFIRLNLIAKYGHIGYLMRFNKYVDSPYKGMYINLARWINQPSIFKKMTIREFCEAHGENSATMRYLKAFLEACPDFKWLDWRWTDQKT